jgi:uncharacterized membrane protein YhaH (DUF805 family)
MTVMLTLFRWHDGGLSISWWAVPAFLLIGLVINVWITSWGDYVKGKPWKKQQ